MLSTRTPWIKTADDPIIDAFGRLRVAQPHTVFDSKQLFDNLPLFWDDQETSGSGTTSVHSTDRASSLMSVSNLTAGTRVRQTKRRFNYQPGKSHLIILTGVVGVSTTGITRRVGYFDENNGVFLESNETDIRFVIRSSVTGSPVDTNFKIKSEWTLDEMDGEGKSKLTLDLSKAQIIFIDLEWLGVGKVRVGFVVNGVIYYVHEFNHANIIDSVYMSTPNLPLRYEISNDGSGPAASLEHICSTIISEGGVEDTGVVLTESNDNGECNANADGTLYAALGIRLKSTHLSATVDVLSATLLGTTSNDNFRWGLYLNPTVDGTFTYADVTNSALQVAKASGNPAPTLTANGYFLNGGYGAQQTSIGNVLINELDLGALIDGTPDEIVLAVGPVSGGSNLDLFGSLTWREFQ